MSTITTPTRTISFADARALVERHISAPNAREVALTHLEAFAADNAGVGCYDHGAELDSLLVGEQPILVVGSLVLRGELQDLDGVDNSLFIVTGDLHAAHLFNWSAGVVGGSVRVRGVVYGNSLCDYALTVGGDLEAATLIEDGHSFDVAGVIRAGTRVSLHGRLADADVTQANLQERVVPEVTSDGSLDGGSLMEHVRQGQSLFRPQ